MPNNKMLIDATHPEETRVVVLRNGRVEEFDYESAARKLLRGNIYLAKVTRVEPSLQAAFVDYGGNRHGFLAFNEIHPDYYQIPVADRQALLEEEAAAEAAEEAAADAHAERLARRRRHRVEEPEDLRSETFENAATEAGGNDSPPGPDEPDAGEPASIAEATMAPDDILVEEPAELEAVGGFEPQPAGDDGQPSAPSAAGSDSVQAQQDQVGRGVEDGGVQEVSGPAGDAEAFEQVGAEDALEELPSRPRRRPRSYKIQEVIKRRQVILVQVVKEERGNKGAALTTYLSLAGRYTVLMPNTARGGGISRKITNPQDRKRLKAIAAELEVPEGMGLIIRTAGAARTRQEIKRDFEYLLRLWESVRDLTLRSTAPSLVYEEGNLIKRSIRDLYNKDVEEIVVAGEHAHKEAKDFMRMLMPSHAKNVVLHHEPEPLFTRYGIERQLNAMFSPYVTLKSGGYLVINQTEALVAIDVNSGKATREFSIEETALNTNLEAADEIARQLKLRDLAGLIVIDFIDMEEKRNNRAVERRLKEALRFDRARIQLGRISHFGLMEMSRQRLRTGVLEGSTSQCPHCQGTGIIRSTESVALAVLRGLEDALMAGARTSLVATTTASVALYILNNKRNFIHDMEGRYGLAIAVQASDKLQGANFVIEKGHAPAGPLRREERSAVSMDWGFEGAEGSEAEAEPYADGSESEPEARPGDEARDDGRRRRRRRPRRGDRPGGEPFREARQEIERNVRSRPPISPSEPGPLDGVSGREAGEEGEAEGREAGDDASRPSRREDRDGRRRRRGRRGGRRGRERDQGPAAMEGTRAAAGVGLDEAAERPVDGDTPLAGGRTSASDGELPGPAEGPASEAEPQPKAARGRSSRSSLAHGGKDEGAPSRAAEEGLSAKPEPEARATARSRTRSQPTSSEPKLERVVVRPDQAEPSLATDTAETVSGPTRRGWWQRKLHSEG